jgi:hypothetical protein
MQTLAELVVAERIRDLQRDAEADRRARAVVASRRSRAVWRRGAGAAARRVSHAFESLAVQLDPHLCQPSYGRE